MEKTTQQKNKRPWWVAWAAGYAGVLAGSAGLAQFWRIVFSLGAIPLAGFALGLAGVFTVLYLGLFIICRFYKEKLSLKAAFCVFALGLVFCFATAPLQAPDEAAHFKRAYAIAHGEFTYDFERNYPADVDLLLLHFPVPLNHQVKFAAHPMAPAQFVAYKADLQAGVQPDDSRQPPPPGEMDWGEEPIMFLIIPFLPQALGMAVGRLFGLSALGLMYAGRIGNLLVYCLLAYFTFKNCSKYRGVFFTLALLPISLFMAASCSYDGLLLGLSYFAISLFCKEKIYQKDIVLFGLAVVLGYYIKQTSIVLAAVLLLVPKTRWKTKWNPWVAFGVILAASLGFAYIMQYIDFNILRVNWPDATLPRGSGENANVTEQLAFMLRNPFRFVSTALLTMYEEAGFLFKLGLFGATDMLIPLVSGLSVLSMCAGGALGIQQKEDTKNGGAWGLFLAAMLYAAAVMAGMYVAETDVGSIRIVGVQPRYFLPVFLLLFMLASILLGKAVQPRLASSHAAQRTEAVTLWIAAGVALLAGILLFQNYFIGQWLPKSEGGWHLVNMLYGLPQ